MDEYIIVVNGQKIRGEIIEVHFDVGVAKLRVMGSDIDLIERPGPKPNLFDISVAVITVLYLIYWVLS